MFSNQQQLLHRCLPFFGVVFWLGQSSDSCIAQREQRFSVRQ
jgi:hypothetical protein